MLSDFEKRLISWRGFRKISAKLPISHALRHAESEAIHAQKSVCGWRFSLQMHCNTIIDICYLVFGLVVVLDLWLRNI